MIGRDIILSGIRELAAVRKQALSADILGKLKTVLQMSAIILMLLSFFYDTLYSVGAFLIWTAAVVSLISCGNYLRYYLFSLMRD